MADMERDRGERGGQVVVDFVRPAMPDRARRDRSGRFLPQSEAAKPAGRSTSKRRAGASVKRAKARKPVAWSIKREALFLETLAETGNVAASIRASGLSETNV